MATYRPVDIRVWDDRKFLALSDDGRMLWLYLLTSPFAKSIPGVIVAGEAALAEVLGWSPNRLGKGFGELVTNGLGFAREGRLIWLKNALKYQPIAGPNALKGMAKIWDDIPGSVLKREIWEALRDASKSRSKLFRDLFPEPLTQGVTQRGTPTGSIQDQDQDQDQEREREESDAGASILSLDAHRLKSKTDRARAEWDALAEAAVSEINAHARTAYRADSTATLKDCKRLFESGRTPEQIRAVIQSKRGWLGDDRMRSQFKPSVLLRPSNFERYLEDLQAGTPQPVAQTNSRQSEPQRGFNDLSKRP